MRQIISSEYLLPNLGSRLQFTKMFRPLCEYPSLRHLLFDRSRYRDRFSMSLMSYWLFLSRRYRMFMANFFRFISS